MRTLSDALPILLAGLGGGLLALALRDGARGLGPGAADYVRSAVDALRRAGREGRLPSVLERRRLGVVAGVALGSGAVLVAGPGAPALLAGFGPALAGWAIARRHRRYRAAVEAELPVIAAGLADALAAGTSVRGAIADLAPTLDGAARIEIARVNADIAIGVSPRRSLEGFAGRMGSEPVAALIAAVLSLQRSGGDLASLLRRYAETEAGRQRSLAEARSETAQARLTGGMVAAMPVGAMILVELVDPGFVASMLADPAALVLLGLAAILQLIAFGVIQRFGAVRR